MIPANLYASRTYAEGFAFKFTENQIKDIAKSEYSTHLSKTAEKIHHLSEVLMKPGYWNIQSLARVIEPLPGANKNKRILGTLIRICSVAAWILTLPFAIPFSLIGMTLRLIDHGHRPLISVINNTEAVKPKNKDSLLLTKENPLRVRTHNTGLTPTAMSTTGDLRHPVERAKELVEAIHKDENRRDGKQPDIICFHEAFSEDAIKTLCEGIKSVYPYIIHSVAPQISGFKSGALIASKYPLESVEFQHLNGHIPPETIAPKGLIRVTLRTADDSLITINSVHTQALLGEERSQARLKQLEQVRKIMESGIKEHAVKEQQKRMEILCGDLNISSIDAWGGDHTDPKQSESEVLNFFNKHFRDLYLNDHEEYIDAKKACIRKRKDGAPAPEHLAFDNEQMGTHFTEPMATWYDGPYYNPGAILGSKMKRDRFKHNRPEPEIVIPRRKDPFWGKNQFYENQIAENARFDYFAILKSKDALDGTVEARRMYLPPGSQSSFSDHLPVDCAIFKK